MSAWTTNKLHVQLIRLRSQCIFFFFIFNVLLFVFACDLSQVFFFSSLRSHSNNNNNIMSRTQTLWMVFGLFEFFSIFFHRIRSASLYSFNYAKAIFESLLTSQSAATLVGSLAAMQRWMLSCCVRRTRLFTLQFSQLNDPLVNFAMQALEQHCLVHGIVVSHGDKCSPTRRHHFFGVTIESSTLNSNHLA